MWRLILFITVLSFSTSFMTKANAGVCDIYIHGYGPLEHWNLGTFPHQISWESNADLADAAPKLAKNILDEIDTCNDGDIIILRPYSYGAAAVFYVIAQGHRFEQLYPKHDFVKVYKKVNAVYSYGGGYNGTPLMDIVCSNKVTKEIANLVGNNCVPALSTSKVFHASSEVTNPGVPIHLIYSTNYTGLLHLTDPIIGTYGVSWNDYLFKRVRNQHDSILPLASPLACAELQTITDPNANCKKMDATYFLDFKKVHDDHLQMGFDLELLKATSAN